MMVQWGKWFGLSSFFLLTILLLQLISESSDQFLSDDLSTIFSWLSLRCLDFIPWILPIACFSATLLTVSFLMIKGEMTGILSCSFSVIYCFRSIFILGFLISIAAWLSMVYYHDLKQRLAFESTELSQESHFQMKIDTKRLWYFSRFDLERKRGENVHLYAMIRKEMIATELGLKKRIGIPKIIGFSRMGNSWALLRIRAFPLWIRIPNRSCGIQIPKGLPLTLARFLLVSTKSLIL